MGLLSAELSGGRKLLFLSYFIAQNSVWITAFGWIATYLVNSGVTGPTDYLLIALVPAWGTIIGLLSQPVFSVVTDLSTSRWGRRRPYILIGGLFGGIWFFLLPFFSLYAWIFLFYGLSSLSLNLSEVSYAGFFKDKISLRDRGKISGAMLSLSLVATFPLITGLIGFEILGQPNFLAYPFLFGGITTIIFTLPTVLFLRDQPSKSTMTMRERLTPRAGFREFRENKDLRRISIVTFLYNIASGMMVPFALLYLEQEIGIPTDIGTLLNALILLATFVFCFPLGVFADRRGRRPILGFAGVCLVMSMLLLFLNGITIQSFAVAMAAFGFMGMAFTTLDFVPRSYVADIAPPDKEAQYFAINNICSTITFPIGIIFGGLTGEIYSSLRYIPLIVAIISIILLAYVIMMKETAPHKSRTETKN